MDNGNIPYHTALQMQETIRKTMENAFIKSGQEVDAAMTTNIRETLPWADYGEAFRKLEEQSRAEGKAEGIAEIVRNMMARDMAISDIADVTGLPQAEIEKYCDSQP